jgi:hypothetical protein
LVVLVLLKRCRHLRDQDTRLSLVPGNINVNSREFDQAAGRNVAKVDRIVIAVLELRRSLRVGHDAAQLHGVFEAVLDAIPLGPADARAVASDRRHNAVLWDPELVPIVVCPNSSLALLPIAMPVKPQPAIATILEHVPAHTTEVGHVLRAAASVTPLGLAALVTAGATAEPEELRLDLLIGQAGRLIADLYVPRLVVVQLWESDQDGAGLILVLVVGVGDELDQAHEDVAAHGALCGLGERSLCLLNANRHPTGWWRPETAGKVKTA